MIPFMHRMAPSEPADNPLWLVVLADMMTNLMLFFLVMFSMAQQGQQAQKAMARSFDANAVVDPEPKPVKPSEFTEDQASEALKKQFPDVTATQDMIRVRLRSQPLFSSGQADLTPAAGETIASLAAVLGQMPNEIIVEGHTDDVRLSNSPYKSNWELSVARSYSVIAALVEAGIKPERLVAAGYGEHRPVAANDSTEGRALNRRVEVIIRRGKIDAHE